MTITTCIEHLMVDPMQGNCVVRCLSPCYGVGLLQEHDEISEFGGEIQEFEGSIFDSDLILIPVLHKNSWVLLMVKGTW